MSIPDWHDIKEALDEISIDIKDALDREREIRYGESANYYIARSKGFKNPPPPPPRKFDPLTNETIDEKE